MPLKNICIALLCLAPLLMTGCGFEPVYSKRDNTQMPANDGSKVFAGVDVAKITGRDGHQLQSELEDLLNPGGKIPERPQYRLIVTLDLVEAPVGVSRDATVSRYNIHLDSRYTLYRNTDGKQIAQGALRHVSSYSNATNAYFSTYISRDDAIKGGITELAELYKLRLSAYMYAGAPEQEIKQPRQSPAFYTPVKPANDPTMMPVKMPAPVK
jgi:hypothetical protein